ANTTPPSITRKSATAIAGSATITRAARSERSRRGAGRLPAPERAAAVRGRPGRARIATTGPLSGAEAPASPRILLERLLERLAREVGPQLLAKHELGVGRLPQQVVGQTLLATRADDQVGVVHLGRI